MQSLTYVDNISHQFAVFCYFSILLNMNIRHFISQEWYVVALYTTFNLYFL